MAKCYGLFLLLCILSWAQGTTRICNYKSITNQTISAFNIEHPREGIIEDSTNGIFAVWTAEITDNISDPVILHLEQTAFDGARTLEGSGPIDMGRGKYTFASPAVTTSRYSLLVVSGDQQRYIENFKVSVNWTSGDGVSSLSIVTGTINSTTSISSIDGAGLLTSSYSLKSTMGGSAGTTHPGSHLTGEMLAPTVPDMGQASQTVQNTNTTGLHPTDSEIVKANSALTSRDVSSATIPVDKKEPSPNQNDTGLDTGAKIGIGVGIAVSVVLAGIAGIVFREKYTPYSPGGRPIPPQIIDLADMRPIRMPPRARIAELHAQTLCELHA